MSATLIVCAVAQEADAVVRGLATAGADNSVDVVVSGAGPVAAATTTAGALAESDYSLVISAGIAGGFAGRVDVGDVVIATSSVAADLGCRTDEGFLSLRELGLDQDSGVAFANARKWCDRLLAAGLPAVNGTVLTLSCMTGTDDEAASLAARHPEAVAEAMEGWGVVWPAYARQLDEIEIGEIRAISNVIGKRDPSTWDIVGAFDALTRAFAALFAEPLP